MSSPPSAPIFFSMSVEPFSMSKSLYIPLHECRALFHSSLPAIMCEDMHDSSPIPNNAISGSNHQRLQSLDGKFTGGRNQIYNTIGAFHHTSTGLYFLYKTEAGTTILKIGGHMLGKERIHFRSVWGAEDGVQVQCQLGEEQRGL